MMNPSGLKQGVRPFVLLFALLTIIYHSNLRPVASADSIPASLIPFSILLDGTVTLDRFAPFLIANVPFGSAVLRRSGGHWYSVYPIGGPVLTTPLYLPLAFVPSMGDQPPGTLVSIARIAEKVVAAALAAAAALALLLLLRRLTSERAAWILTLVFALGTGNWSASSQALWQHTFGQCALIGCFHAIERLSAPPAQSRWYWMAGTFAAIAVAIRPTNLVLLPVLVLILWLRRARLLDYARAFLPAVLAAIPLAAYNFAVFHRFRGTYSLRLKGGYVDALLGLLLSPGRGLLIYTPIAIFALAAFMPRARASREQHRPVVIAAGVFSILYLAFMAMWPVWWGGYSWGPRLLTELLAPLMILIAVGLPAIQGSRWKWAFAAAAVYGCLIQALGVYCYPKGRWDHLPVSVNSDQGRLWDWVDNPIIRTARAGVAWEPYSIAAAAVRGGFPAAAAKLRELSINPY
jgi:hypothetical protein